MRALLFLVLSVIAFHQAFATEFLTREMVEKSFQFYNKPYPGDPNSYAEKFGYRVYRPNHGIAHGVRKAAAAQDLQDVIMANAPGGEMQTWLAAKIAADPNFHYKFNMTALLSRSGRENERDDNPPEDRSRQMKTGATNFKQLVSDIGLVFKDKTEVEDFAQAIILDGHYSDNDDRNHLSRLLRAAHNIELRRLGWDTDPSLRGLIPELTDANIEEFHKREAAYLKTTGVTAGSFDFQLPFFELSNNMPALWEAMIAVRNTFN